MLPPRQIAALILQGKNSNQMSKSAPEKSDLPFSISSDVFDTLTTSVLSAEQSKEVHLLSGLATETKVDQFSSLISSLKESIDTGKLTKASPKTHDKP